MKRRLVLASIFLLATSLNLAAAEFNTGDIPRAEQPRALPSVRPVEIKKPEKPTYKPKNTNSAIKLSVETFTFTGNDSFSDETLNQLLSDYQKRDIGIDELNKATQVITDFYRNNGYFLGQAYLPAQDVAGNTLEIAILEGKLGVLSTKDTEGFDSTFMNNMAAYRLGANDTVSEHNLVRNVTIINALPGTKATARLAPSASVGATDIDVILESLPSFQGYVGANTYGNRFTGREVVIAGAKLNNPVGLGDQLSLDLKRSNNNGQRGLSLGYITPVHESGTLFSVGYNYIDYKLGRQLEPLDASGESQYFNLGLNQPIIRDAHKGLSAQFGASYKIMNDEVAAFSLENRRKITAAELGLTADWLSSNGRVNYLAGAKVRAGNVKFKNDVAKSLDETGAQTKGGFAKYNLSATRLQYFGNGASFALHANYQRASKNLDSVEKMSIGNSAWRQYAELPSLADSGIVVGAEVRKKVIANKSLNSLLLIDISPYVFVDLGRGKINQRTNLSDNHVKSIHAGFGLDATFRNGWVFNFSGSQQNRDFTGAGAENETRVWGQLLKYF